MDHDQSNPAHIMRQRISPFLSIFAAVTMGVCLGGCAQFASPSQSLFGAYFPYWLSCVAIGVVGTTLIRAVFIRIGLDEILPARIVVYGALAALIGFAVALSVYGR